MTDKLTKEDIFAKMKPIITAHLGPTGNPRDPFEQKVTLEADLETDLEADSLDRVELTMAYEEEFDIEIPDADVEAGEPAGLVNGGVTGCKTVGDQVNKIHALLDKVGRAG